MKQFSNWLRKQENYELAQRIAQRLGKDVGTAKTVFTGLFAVLLASHVAAVEIETWEAIVIVIAFAFTWSIAYIAELLRHRSHGKRRVVAVIDIFVKNYDESGVSDTVKDIIGGIIDILKK